METKIARLICGAAFAGTMILGFLYSPSKQTERMEAETDIALCKKLAADVAER